MPSNEPIEDIGNVVQEGNDDNEIVVTAPRQTESFFEADSFDFIYNGPGDSYVLAYDHTNGVGALYASGPNGEPTVEYFDHPSDHPHTHDTPSDVIFMDAPIEYDLF